MNKIAVNSSDAFVEVLIPLKTFVDLYTGILIITPFTM
jgi:hypothetical protein